MSFEAKRIKIKVVRYMEEFATVLSFFHLYLVCFPNHVIKFFLVNLHSKTVKEKKLSTSFALERDYNIIPPGPPSKMQNTFFPMTLQEFLSIWPFTWNSIKAVLIFTAGLQSSHS